MSFTRSCAALGEEIYRDRRGPARRRRFEGHSRRLRGCRELAGDIDRLAQRLNLERAYLVGHDLGGIVAYAFGAPLSRGTARRHDPRCPLPGIEPWGGEVKADPLLWHINFHQTPDLPEQLIAGRQAVYFRHFWSLGTVNGDGISDDDAAHYASAYAAPEQLRAGFEMYRALPANEKFNAAQRGEIDLPLVLAGGDQGFPARFCPTSWA